MKPSLSIPSRWLRGAVVVLLARGVACTDAPSSERADLESRLTFEGDPAGAGSRGELVVSHVMSGGNEPAGAKAHPVVFVPGRVGVTMEDNDLRGFLDGTFKWGWNQPGQSHVRFGRRLTGPQYGEHELFRVIQLWEGVRLPPTARVTGADLVLQVEDGPERPVYVLLYRVNRDWNPGEGGTQRDNVSPPSRGEAWWNGPRFGEESWGLPGLGYAGPENDADTPETALADAFYTPGDSLMVFTGGGLTSYVQRRSTSGTPLRFLLKTSDMEEDQPGSQVIVYSADYGDTRNSARRPRLEVRWTSDGERVLHRRWMILEHGRTTAAGPFSVSADGWLNVDFLAAPGYESPLVEVRGGAASGDTSRWIAASRPIENRWTWFQLRARALRDPVEIGSPVEFEIHETWVLEEPSEADVRVAFLAPSGKRHVLTPRYEDPYRWRVDFVPEELGAWRYRWAADFAELPMVSPVGRFDVIATTRSQLVEALRDLVRDLESGSDGSTAEAEFLYRRFLGVEREALRLETPESFRTTSNEALELLRRARELLGGAPVPDSIPLVVSPSHRGR